MSAHDSKAQLAGEEALERLYEAEDDGECVCATCTVREVLDAAWPHLRAMAFEEASQLLMGASLEAKSPTELLHKLAALIDEWRSA